MTASTVSRCFHLLLLLFFLPRLAAAATVASVTDGDTVRLSNGDAVRYLGINTPERGQPFYDEARRLNEKLVLGKEVRLEMNGRTRDHYGRLLARIYVGEVLVNARLVAEGLAHVYIMDAFDQAEEWIQLQKTAQGERKGMWRDGVSGPLRITRVNADAPGDDRRNPNGEYVRLCNVSDTPLDLTGFSVQDTARHRYVFPGGILEPGHVATLSSGQGRDTTSNPRSLTFHWGAGPIWNNDEDVASLFAPDGKSIDTFRVGREEAESETPSVRRFLLSVRNLLTLAR